MIAYCSCAIVFVLLLIRIDAAFWGALGPAAVKGRQQHRPNQSTTTAPIFGVITSSRQAPGVILPTKMTGLHYTKDDQADDGESEASSTYFQMQQIPTATSGDKLDHIVDCAEYGECDIEEMMNMIDELEKLNAECEGEHSRECNLDAVAARNVLKVALASKVMVEDALHNVECIVPPSDDNPYAELAEMEDECQPDYYHNVPSDTTERSSKLDRIVECADETSTGHCDIEEMTQMVEELEKLNQECEGALSRECSLDAVAARNILKVALASKVTLEEGVSQQPWANGSP